MNKEKLEELRQRMIRHDVVNDQAVVTLSAAELQDLIEVAEPWVKKNSEPIENNKYSSWMFNVVDEFKSLSKEDIIEKINCRKLPFAIMMGQVLRDFNFASVVRSANFLGAREIFHYGHRRYDRRGTTGAYHYSPSIYLSSMDEIVKLKERYSFVALENNLDFKPKSLHSFVWPIDKMPLILVGEEGCGLSKEMLDLCDHFVEIPGRGSIRSLNAAGAAGIAMFDFITKYGMK